MSNSLSGTNTTTETGPCQVVTVSTTLVSTEVSIQVSTVENLVVVTATETKQVEMKVPGPTEVVFETSTVVVPLVSTQLVTNTLTQTMEATHTVECSEGYNYPEPDVRLTFP